MPRKTGKANENSNPFSRFRFVNISLTADEKERLGEFAADSRNHSLSEISALSVEKYKVSFSRDKDNGAYTVSLTDMDTSRQSFGWILVGRGSTPINAWCALYYKHTVLLGRDWATNYSMEDGSGGDFG